MESESEIGLEDEETGEELLIYVEFDQVLDDEIFERSPAFKLIGQNSDEPYLQIDNQVFQDLYFTIRIIRLLLKCFVSTQTISI